MTRIHWLLGTACLGALVALGCSQAGPGGVTTPTGGSHSGGSSATGAAGATTSGGTTAAGGTSSQGGSVVGGSATGGDLATGGASGGSPAVGAGGSSSGGAPASGGATSAGAGGAATGAGGSGLTVADIVPDLQSFYWEGTCGGTIAVSGHNCPLSGSASSCDLSVGINREKTIPVKGTPGQLYTINIEVRGVIGTRCYDGGKRASSAPLNQEGNNNWWYVGGVYLNPTGWWNTYELHVSPSTGDASGDVYYFNGSDVKGGDSCEKEATYLVKYTASFKAKGGGTLTFKIHDQNCSGLQNCGSGTDGTAACAPRTVDLTGMTAPAGFTQPPANMQWKPQWMLVAATSVTSP